VKTNQKCPKCGSIEILKLEHGCIQPRDFVEVGILRPVAVIRHICSECGYVEEWIDPPPRLKELVDKMRTERL
jgi:ribosomal protein S27AE